MIGYICKYTPVELFEAMGLETEKIDPEVMSFNEAESIMHPNVCSYVKAVLEVLSKDDRYEGVILTSCCDSVRRLYDAAKRKHPDKFIYLLDVPRKVVDFSVTLYAKRVTEMLSAYREFNPLFSLSDGEVLNNLTKIISEKKKEEIKAEYPADKIRIGLMGARCPESVYEIIRSNENIDLVFDVTCTGLQRNVYINASNPLNSYMESLLNQVPCMRMLEGNGRRDYAKGFGGNLDGIIYHMVKFCDMYSFEYADGKANPTHPMLLLETDYTPSNKGQIATRIEAFVEELAAKRGLELKKSLEKAKTGADGHMYVCGIDSGSTSTNAVIINEKREIISFKVIRTGAKAADSCHAILDEVVKEAGLKKEDLSRVVATGYGRISADFADDTVTEITCHGKGAHLVNPEVGTIIDIGGQDSKAIKLDENGNVKDFVMNDKCAAGTGRFLEAMARTLELPIEELGPVSLNWKEDISISSMCTVFAESEVISLIALNKEKPDIAHGVHKAIAGKAMTLVKKVGVSGTVMMTGGVAKNPGVVKAIEDVLGDKLYIYKEPEIMGALGAAVCALEQLGV